MNRKEYQEFKASWDETHEAECIACGCVRTCCDMHQTQDGFFCLECAERIASDSEYDYHHSDTELVDVEIVDIADTHDSGQYADVAVEFEFNGYRFTASMGAYREGCDFQPDFTSTSPENWELI
jgi:hypothetical protein